MHTYIRTSYQTLCRYTPPIEYDTSYWYVILHVILRVMYVSHQTTTSTIAPPSADKAGTNPSHMVICSYYLVGLFSLHHHVLPTAVGSVSIVLSHQDWLYRHRTVSQWLRASLLYVTLGTAVYGPIVSLCTIYYIHIIPLLGGGTRP